jgi:hypothetical protein
VNEPEQRDGHPVSEHPLEDTVAVIAGIEAVAVMDEEPFPLVLRHDLVGMEIQPDRFPEVVPEPVIVVSREQGDPGAGTDQIVQFEDHFRSGAGNHGAVFEPEVEKVADNIEMGCPAPEFPEERGEPFRPAGIVPGEAEMDIGDEHDTVGKMCGGSLHVPNIHVTVGVFQERITAYTALDNRET